MFPFQNRLFGRFETGEVIQDVSCRKSGSRREGTGRAGIALALLAVLAGGSGVASRPAEASAYSIVDLGPLPGYDSSWGVGVNDFGGVAGVSYHSGSTAATLWNPDGSVVNLGAALGSNVSSGALSVNNHGKVAGSFQKSATQTLAAYWGADGKFHDIAKSPIYSSYATAINGKDQIVGHGFDFAGDSYGDSLYDAFLWSWTSGLVNLGALPGDSGQGISEATGINWLGEVAGISYDIVWNDGGAGNTWFYTTTDRAFLWVPDSWNGATGRMYDLAGAGYRAVAINDPGDVLIEDDNDEVYLWTPTQPNGAAGALADLGFSGFVSAINKKGQVVGDNGGGVAVIWDKTHGLRDLNALIPAGTGWTLWEARGISNAGYITGNGSFNGVKHAFLLKPEIGG